MKSILITHALEAERIELSFSGYDCTQVITGIGKTASSFALMKALTQQTPCMVINIGTAGTVNHHIGDILLGTAFIDRDLESTRLPGVPYSIEATANELPPAVREWPSILQGQAHNACFTVNTGDNFVTDLKTLTGDVVDMEAYAQAFICQEEKIPFIAVKYVTDIIGKNSVAAWEQKLHDACTALTAYFEERNL